MTNACKTTKQFRAVDVFSGAGGMSIGASMAGIQIDLAVEFDKYAAATYIENHPYVNVLIQDITTVNPKDHTEINPFVLFGGPPCQGFSTSNTKTRNDDNKNNHLYKEFLRFTDILKPDWIVFENVEGITKYNKGKFVKSLVESFHNLGYTDIISKVLIASDYGVPQFRNRFFIIGNRKGIKPSFPNPLTQKVTVNDALSDLPDLKNGDMIDSLPYKKINNLSKYAQFIRNGSVTCDQNYLSRNQNYVIERYAHIKPGENWQAIPEHLMHNYTQVKNCHSGIYKRLNPEIPSVVISNYRKNMLIHPFQNRGLSIREAARLQSFPDNFKFKGPLIHMQQQIGNAVPPLLAKAIFEHIISLKKN
jgi:DNA (cytosine-5)-methyltransferase 1